MTFVDLYCERVAAGLLAEPLNAVTNIAFFAVAWHLWRLARKSDALTASVATLIGLIVAFGTGSLLFHTFATSATRLLDVMPIALFTVAYLWVYARQILHLGQAVTAASAAVLVSAAYGGMQFPGVLNGSLIYAPAIVFMLGLGTLHWMQARKSPADLLGAAGLFAAALFFRTIDNAICSDVSRWYAFPLAPADGRRRLPRHARAHRQPRSGARADVERASP